MLLRFLLSDEANNMFKEYDVVIANKVLSGAVYKGTSGTVLICYPNDNYEVEFMEENGESLDVLTVSGDALTLLIPFNSD